MNKVKISSNNFVDLRMDDIIPPAKRVAASAARKGISAFLAHEKRGAMTMARAIKQVCTEWSKEAIEPARRTVFQQMEALVYRYVLRQGSLRMPIARGRAILQVIDHPSLNLDDVLRVLGHICKAVRSCGVKGVHMPTWPRRSRAENVDGVADASDSDASTDSDSDDSDSDSDSDASTDSDDSDSDASTDIDDSDSDSDSMPAPPSPLKPSAPLKHPNPPAAKLTMVARKSMARAALSKRVAVEAKRDAPVVAANNADAPANDAPSLFAAIPVAPADDAPSLFAAIPVAPANDAAAAVVPEPVTPANDAAGAVMPEPVTPANDAAGAVMPEPVAPTNYAAGAVMPELVLSPFFQPPAALTMPRPLAPLPPAPWVGSDGSLNVGAMWARLAEVDRDVMLTWAQKRSVADIDALLRGFMRELDSIDAELIEHWDQLPLSLLLNRMFHERTSRHSFSDPAKVTEVVEHMLRGFVTGSAIGKPFDPNSQTSHALLCVAKHHSLWCILCSVLTYHQRTDHVGRSASREHLHLVRRLLLIEAGHASRA